MAKTARNKNISTNLRKATYVARDLELLNKGIQTGNWKPFVKRMAQNLIKKI